MQSQTFKDGLSLLRAAYPQSRIDFNAPLVAVWAAALESLPDDAFTAAVYQSISESEFFPSIAELRKRALAAAQVQKDNQAAIGFDPKYNSIFQTEEKMRRYRHNIALIMQVVAKEITKKECDSRFLYSEFRGVI